MNEHVHSALPTACSELDAGRKVWQGMKHLVAWLSLAMSRRRQRRQLRLLDDHLLHDIGITRGQAEREADKPFWRV